MGAGEYLGWTDDNPQANGVPYTKHNGYERLL